jgi:hypothetical protein
MPSHFSLELPSALLSSHQMPLALAAIAVPLLNPLLAWWLFALNHAGL